MSLIKIKSIREKLISGGVSIGTWQQIGDSSISEILGCGDYDWVAVDLEHGSISTCQLPNLFRAIELNDTLPLARIANSDPTHCKQALDAGAGGIIAPMIENAETLKIIRDACYWPPRGNRGVGFSRANLFGKNFNDYNEEAQIPLLVAQIEHITAVQNLESILKVDGLDALMIGPYDLSASMNLTGQFENKDFIAVLDEIIQLCTKFNIPTGYHVVTQDDGLLKKKIDEGYRFIAYCTDGIFLTNNSENPY